MRRLAVICFLGFLCFSQIQAHPGIGIVMDSKGNVFYTDLSHVWKISSDGERTLAVRDVHTHELYIDSQDNLYGEHEYYNGEVIDTWGDYVWCLNSSGEFKKTIPDVEGFLDDNTLVRDLNDNSYWAEKSGGSQVLKKQTPSGRISTFSNHRFNDIRWKYFSKTDQYLYIIDLLSVKKVSPEGKVSIVAENLKENGPPFENVADRHYLFGLWADQGKNLFVAVYGAGKVKKVDFNGDVTTVYESPNGWSPCGGLSGPDGTMWIMEFSSKNTTRVIKITKDGKQTRYGG